MTPTLARAALALGAATLLAASALPAAEPNAVPKPGDQAPLVEGLDQDGQTWKLADRIGRTAVLLYFYPKDDTPGCTKQACGLRDRLGELQAQKVEVIGVSFDSPESHRKFIAKYSLNFSLLADTEGTIAAAYGAGIPNRKMARRVSFLIDRQGRIAHVTDTPSADTHLAEMKEAVARLGKGS